MSRRQRTTLTLSVRIPVPVGKTQKQVLETITQNLKMSLAEAYAVNEIIVKIEGRTTVYL